MNRRTKLLWRENMLPSRLGYALQVETVLLEGGFNVASIQSKGPAGWPNQATTLNLIISSTDNSSIRGFKRNELQITKNKIRELLQSKGFKKIKVTNTSYGTILVVVPYLIENNSKDEDDD